jgi:hypothetical protein
MSPQPALSRTLVRRLAGQCCYGACTEKPIDGSDYCAPHDAHERGRAAQKQKRRRARRALAKQCMEGCGRKVGKRLTDRGSVLMRRCPTCAKADREAKAMARRVPADTSRVPGKPTRGFTKVEHGEGYRAERYVGRDRRGAPSRADLDEDLRSDLADAERELAAVRTKGIAILRSVAESLCPGRARELRREQAEAVEVD